MALEVQFSSASRREEKTTHRLDATSWRRRNHLKVEKQSDGKTTIIWLIGRIRADDLDEIKKQIDDGSEQTVLDLCEVTIVDADVVQFPNERELEGTPLVACPPYIREWIMRERARGAN
jgi:hypothetical protein